MGRGDRRRLVNVADAGLVPPAPVAFGALAAAAGIELACAVFGCAFAVLLGYAIATCATRSSRSRELELGHARS
jgi:hypothetical protein